MASASPLISSRTMDSCCLHIASASQAAMLSLRTRHKGSCLPYVYAYEGGSGLAMTSIQDLKTAMVQVVEHW